MIVYIYYLRYQMQQCQNQISSTLNTSWVHYPIGKYHPVNAYIAISFPALKSVPDLCTEYRTLSWTTTAQSYAFGHAEDRKWKHTSSSLSLPLSGFCSDLRDHTLIILSYSWGFQKPGISFFWNILSMQNPCTSEQLRKMPPAGVTLQSISLLIRVFLRVLLRRNTRSVKLVFLKDALYMTCYIFHINYQLVILQHYYPVYHTPLMWYSWCLWKPMKGQKNQDRGTGRVPISLLSHVSFACITNYHEI